MSSARTRIPLAEAEALAAEVGEVLRPACERIAVAGSIRRRKAMVGDIELVAIPKLGDQPTDLFGNPAGERADLLDALCGSLRAGGVLTDRPDVSGRPAWGSRYKRARYKGVALDLFSVLEPAQWGVIFALRTGPAEYSHRLVTPRPFGWMPSGLHLQGGAVWRNGAIVPTPEEQDFFALIGRRWEPPARRDG